MAKTDKELGQKVKQHLEELGLETPFKPSTYNKTDQLDIISSKFEDIMKVLGLDLIDDSLKDTPNRVAKMFVNEIFEGLDYDSFPKCTAITNKFKCDEMLIEKGIDVSSVCEHHFVTIDGFAKIGYVPKENVIGLSKINRVVRFFSKRPQVQERLTLQIHAALCFILETEDVAVEIEATHFCVKSRGIEDKNSSTVTRKLGGCFRKEHEARAEFLNS